MMNYKVLFIPRLSDDAQFEKEFEKQAEAETALSSIAEYTLMLHECRLMPGYSNTGMVLVKDSDGDWIEIDGDGLEI